MDWTLNEKGFGGFHRGGGTFVGSFQMELWVATTRSGLQRGNSLNKITRSFFFFQLPNATAKFPASLNTREKERQEMYKTDKTAEERQIIEAM